MPTGKATVKLGLIDVNLKVEARDAYTSELEFISFHNVEAQRIKQQESRFFEDEVCVILENGEKFLVNGEDIEFAEDVNLDESTKNLVSKCRCHWDGHFAQGDEHYWRHHGPESPMSIWSIADDAFRIAVGDKYFTVYNHAPSYVRKLMVQMDPRDWYWDSKYLGSVIIKNGIGHYIYLHFSMDPVPNCEIEKHECKWGF